MQHNVTADDIQDALRNELKQRGVKSEHSPDAEAEYCRASAQRCQQAPVPGLKI